MHSFERSSVVEDRRLLTTALKRGYGSVLPEDVSSNFQARGEVIRKSFNDRTFVTTREVIAEEAAAVAFAREGRGTSRPLWSKPQKYADSSLNSGQEAGSTARSRILRPGYSDSRCGWHR